MKALSCACILVFSNGSIWEINDSSAINDITNIAANASAGEALQAYLPQTSDLLSNMPIPTGSFDSSATAPAQSPSIEECISVIISELFWYFFGLFSPEKLPLTVAKILTAIYAYQLTTFLGRKKGLFYSKFDVQLSKTAIALQDFALIGQFLAWFMFYSFTSYMIASSIILGPSIVYMICFDISRARQSESSLPQDLEATAA